MTKDNGGPAFPSPTGNPTQDGRLTVRDWFAGMALQGIIGNTTTLNVFAEFDGDIKKHIAKVAYSQADAMLKARGE